MCDLLFQRSTIHLVLRVLTAKNVLNPMFHLCRKAHSNSIGTRSETQELEHVHDVCCVSHSVLLSQILLFLKRNKHNTLLFLSTWTTWRRALLFLCVSDPNALPVDIETTRYFIRIGPYSRDTHDVAHVLCPYTSTILTANTGAIIFVVGAL
jgi:hypothetical protein